jgi:NhaA family Na+:H+ antiporter
MQTKNRLRAPSILRSFLDSEASGGLTLMFVAALALLIANSPLAPLYFDVLHRYVLGLSVLHWINDALMAVFFLLVGLEIKREFLDGQLATWSRRVLPGIAALGGMVVPAAIFVVLNWGDPERLRGWAIPSATDIAFALGVLSLLGPRVPISLKIFLTALAILDDLGAVLIIAVFYTADLSPLMLGLAAAVLLVLAALNRAGVKHLAPYLALGALLWFFVLKSGIGSSTRSSRGSRLRSFRSSVSPMPAYPSPASPSPSWRNRCRSASRSAFSPASRSACSALPGSRSG